MNFDRIKFIVIFVTPFLIFILLFSKIDIFEFIRIFKEINIFFFLIGILVYLFNDLLVVPLQWLRILLPLGYSLCLKEVAFMKIGSYPAKIFFPLQTGDLVRAIYLKKQKGIPFSIGASSIYITLILNFLVLLIIMSFGYFLFHIDFFYTLLFCLGLLLLFMLSLPFSKFVKDSISCFLIKISPKFYSSLETLFSVYKRINLKNLSMLFLYSVIFWICELTLSFVLFKAAGLNIPFSAIVIFIPLTILVSKIPITVSGLGTRETALLILFSKFGAPERLLTTGVLLSFVNIFLPLMISLFFIKKFLTVLLKTKK